MRRLAITAWALLLLAAPAAAQIGGSPITGSAHGCTSGCSFSSSTLTNGTLAGTTTLTGGGSIDSSGNFLSIPRITIGTAVNHAGEPFQVGGSVGGISAYFIGSTNVGGGYLINANAILTSPAAATWHFGNADANPPVAQTLGFQGASGTNIAGATATIAGSASTGNVAGGDIIFQVTKAGGAGSTQNTYTEGFRIAADAALPKWPSSSTGAGTQTFTNSPCATLTSEQWVPIEITGQTGTWYVPACH